MAERAPTRWLEARAWMLVAAARLLLPLARTGRTLRLLAGARVSQPGRGRATPEPDEALSAVRGAGARLHADCLAQSIALAALFQRGGAQPTVVLGCRRYGAADWGAHAWVELDGAQLDPVPQPDHAALARLSAATAWRIDPAGPERGIRG